MLKQTSLERIKSKMKKKNPTATTKKIKSTMSSGRK